MHKALLIENDSVIHDELFQLCDVLNINHKEANHIVNADSLDKQEFLNLIVDPKLTDILTKSVYAGSSQNQLMGVIRALFHSGRKKLRIHSISYNYLLKALNNIDNGDQFKKAIVVITNNKVMEYGHKFNYVIKFDCKIAKFVEGEQLEKITFKLS